VTGGLLLLTVTVLGGIIAVQYRKLRQTELELGLKDELLLRGYSVDEAIRVVTSQKPRWSQGLIDLGDWAGRRLRSAIRPTSQAAVSAAIKSQQCARRLWASARPHLQQARTRAVPWMRTGLSRASATAHWLGAQADAWVRRLITTHP
jgi:hypothetical protein